MEIKSTDYFKKENELLLKNETEFFNLVFGSKLYSANEVETIIKAYKRAEQLHEGVKRKSGEPYITHPINVAGFLVRFGFDSRTICGGLLHDTVEDTDYTLEDVEKEFGKEIKLLVDGVTKMKNANFSSREEEMIATHKKILESMTMDARIIAIKLADRLHNMLTMDKMPQENKIRKAKENFEFGIPIARTLGIYIIKDAIQDISLFYYDLNKFLKVYNLRENIIKEEYKWPFINFELDMKKKLESVGIVSKFSPKIKNIGGISDELDKGKTLEEIKDLAAIRIILDNIHDCLDTLEYIKDIAVFVPGTFVDYISNPKYNGYRSLNQNIIYSDKNIQIRIRDEEMNRANLLGMVGNWNENSQEIVRAKARELMNLNNENLSAEQYVKKAKQNFLHMTGGE